MKMKRLVALVCALLLAMGIVSAGAGEKAAPSQAPRGMEFDYETVYLIKNGETARFIITPTPWRVYTIGGKQYDDIDFDTDSSIKGKVLSGGNWIRVTNKRGDCRIRIEKNETAKKRTAKIRVTGKKYSATLVFTQWGRSRITSVVRKQDQVTVKLKKGAGPRTYWLQVIEYPADEDGYIDYVQGEYIQSETYSGKTYSFTVKNGNYYEISYGYILPNEAEGYNTWLGASNCNFTVYSINGSEDYSGSIYNH